MDSQNGFLSDDELATVFEKSPVPAVDVILKDHSENVLLAIRRDNPASGYYFVPGGRIRKGETLSAAFSRIVRNETGYQIGFDRAHLIGTYRHFYAENRFAGRDFPTHYVTSAYEVTVDRSEFVKLDEHHSSYQWMSVADLMARSDVHDYVKAYFRPPRINDDFLIGAAIVYETLMSHYVHYDEQMWGRTQLLIAVQGAALFSSWNLPSWLAAVIMLVSIGITLVVLLLIRIDHANSRVNQVLVMDRIAHAVIGAHGLGIPKLRAENLTLFGVRIRGFALVCSVVWVLAVVDLLLGTYYLWDALRHARLLQH